MRGEKQRESVLQPADLRRRVSCCLTLQSHNAVLCDLHLSGDSRLTRDNRRDCDRLDQIKSVRNLSTDTDTQIRDRPDN